MNTGEGEGRFSNSYAQMTDQELLRLSAACEDLVQSARAALAKELCNRANETPSSREVSPWEIIDVPRGEGTEILFPPICPNCLGRGPTKAVSFSSLSESKFRVTHVRSEWLSLRVPHCSECAKSLTSRRTSAVIYVVADLVVSLGLGAWLGWSRIASPLFAFRILPLILFFVLLLPARLLLGSDHDDSIESVLVGEYGDDFISIRFKNPGYAEEFKRLNAIAESDLAAKRKQILLDACRRVNGS